MNTRQKSAIRSIASIPESFNWRIDEGETVQCFHCKVHAPTAVAVFPHRETCPVSYTPVLVREFLAAFEIGTTLEPVPSSSEQDDSSGASRSRGRRANVRPAKAPYDRHAPRGRFAVFEITAENSPTGDPLSRHRIAASAERKASGLFGGRDNDTRYGVFERNDEGNWRLQSVPEPRPRGRNGRGKLSAPRGRRGPRGPHKKFALIAVDERHPEGVEVERYLNRSAAIVAYTQRARELPDAMFEVRRREKGTWEKIWPKSKRTSGKQGVDRRQTR